MYMNSLIREYVKTYMLFIPSNSTYHKGSWVDLLLQDGRKKYVKCF